MEGLLQLSAIAALLGATYTGEERQITHIDTDSRTCTPGCLFIALTGDRFDGHNYIESAQNAGAIAVVVSRPLATTMPQLLVTDTRLAYLAIAGFYRSTQPAMVVAITGSVGKTTTKDMTAAVLEHKYRTLKTKENLNNEIGLSQMLLALDSKYQRAVLELGVDGPNQMEPMAVAAAPNIAIVTTIGESHLENFGSREAIAMEKLAIAKGLPAGAPLLLWGEDDFLLTYLAQNGCPTEQVYFFGTKNPRNHVWAEEIKPHGRGTTCTICYEGEKYPARLPTLGLHNVNNALSAFLAGVLLGVPPQQAVAALEHYTATGMRQNMVEINGITVVEDCYNASPQSMRAAVDAFSGMEVSGRRILVVSDMLELGAGELQDHYNAGQYIANSGITMVLSTGARAKKLHQGASEQGTTALFYETQDELANQIIQEAQPGDVLWFKASRGMRLEHVIEQFYKAKQEARGV